MRSARIFEAVVLLLAIDTATLEAVLYQIAKSRRTCRRPSVGEAGRLAHGDMGGQEAFLKGL
jgi:hypothetical protein